MTLDLDKLEALARAAMSPGIFDMVPIKPVQMNASALFLVEALSPAVVLELIAMARKGQEAEAVLTEAHHALQQCVTAMRTWGSWEDGVPHSDSDDEYGAVGKAYDRAVGLLEVLRERLHTQKAEPTP